jgi:hypothetical protein
VRKTPHCTPGKPKEGFLQPQLLMKTNTLGFPDALRVKSAEFWLILGQPQAALLELHKLSSRALSHPWAQRVFQSAFAACSASYSAWA